MSSMRNAVQRRVHRERGQPEERMKWGLLEKHKDYSARARDYNNKKRKIKALRQKILDKNPDEFYHGMMSRNGPRADKSSNGTVPGQRGNKALSQEAVRLLKTQDLGYVRTVRNQAMKDVSRLEIAVKGISGNGQKVVFVSEQEEEDSKEDDVGDKDDEENKDAPTEDFPTDKCHRRKAQRRVSEKLNDRLAVAIKRLKTLTEAEQALELQRAKMAKSPLIEGVNKHGVRFRVKERKR